MAGEWHEVPLRVLAPHLGTLDRSPLGLPFRRQPLLTGVGWSMILRVGGVGLRAKREHHQGTGSGYKLFTGLLRDKVQVPAPNFG